MSEDKVPAPKEFMGVQLSWVDHRAGGFWSTGCDGDLYVQVLERRRTKYSSPTLEPWLASITVKRGYDDFVRESGD